MDQKETKNKGFWGEFKEFISRGNVMDMAVGVILGGAFTSIVTSLVEDVLTPFIGILSGGVDLSGLSITVEGAVLRYGVFLQNIVNFLIVGFCMFLVVKAMNKMKDRIKPEEEVIEEVKEPDDVVLLREIRDLLEQKN